MAGTWATHATPALGGNQILDMICVGSGKFVAVGEAGTVITSIDSGVTWTSRTAALAVDWFGLGTDGAGNVVAVRTSNTNAVMTSADFGVTWTLRAAPSGNWQAVCWDSGSSQWIAVSTGAGGGADLVMTSPTGVTWTARTAGAGQTWLGVASSGSLIMAVDDAGNVMTSTNGIAWTTHTSPNTQFVNGSDNGNGAIRWSSLLGAFVIAGFDTSISPISAVAYSTPTGAAWTTASTDATTAEFKAIQTADGICGFVASMPFDPDFSPATHTMIGNSVDAGGSWTHEDTTFSGFWYIGAWDNSTGTVVYKDATPNDLMLVGTFPLTSCGGSSFDSIDPVDGSTLGGTPVTCTGTGLTGVTSVEFDGVAATSVVVVDDETVTCVTPAHAAGAVDVEVIGIGTLVNGYTYVAPTFTSLSPTRGTILGNTLVTCVGTFLNDTMVVNFDGIPATVEMASADGTALTCRTPAHAVGLVDVEIVTVGTLTNAYTYIAVISITPNSGTVLGGTPVTIKGGGFTGATSVQFDGIDADNFVVVNDTTIRATTPAHPATGPVDVEVLVGVGTLVGGYTYNAQARPKLPPVPTTSPVVGADGKMHDAYVRWLMAVKTAVEQ